MQDRPCIALGTPVFVYDSCFRICYSQPAKSFEEELERWQKLVVSSDTTVSWVVGRAVGDDYPGYKIAKKDLVVRQPKPARFGSPPQLKAAWSEETIRAEWVEMNFKRKFADTITDKVRYCDATTLRKVAELIGLKVE